MSISIEPAFIASASARASASAPFVDAGATHRFVEETGVERTKRHVEQQRGCLERQARR